MQDSVRRFFGILLLRLQWRPKENRYTLLLISTCSIVRSDGESPSKIDPALQKLFQWSICPRLAWSRLHIIDVHEIRRSGWRLSCPWCTWQMSPARQFWSQNLDSRSRRSNPNPTPVEDPHPRHQPSGLRHQGGVDTSARDSRDSSSRSPGNKYGFRYQKIHQGPA